MNVNLALVFLEERYVPAMSNLNSPEAITFKTKLEGEVSARVRALMCVRVCVCVCVWGGGGGDSSACLFVCLFCVGECEDARVRECEGVEGWKSGGKVDIS